MTTKVHPEPRMLIDGKLVEAGGGKTFVNTNPATEEELGQVADASAEDMDRAIVAARRAFEETDWSTNRSWRRDCLEQLHQALVAEREEMREQLILEVGCPRMLTFGPQLDAPLDGAITYPARLIDEFVWEDDLADATDFRGNRNSRRIVKEPVGVVGAIVPWNFPFEVSITKVAQALATGNTVILKPAPDTPWNATLLGRIVAEHTDIPAGRAQCGDVLGPSGRRTVDPLPAGGPHLVHRLDRRREADHGEGGGHPQAAVPRARRQVGHHRPRRRRFLHGHDVRPRRLCPRRPGLRHPHPHAPPPRPATTRASSC